MIGASDMPDIPEERLIEEARVWLIMLRNEDASVEDFARWDKWLGTSERHRRAYDELGAIWKSASSVEVSGLWPSQDQVTDDSYSGEIAVADYLAQSEHPLKGGGQPVVRRASRERRTALAVASFCLAAAAIVAPFPAGILFRERPSAVLEVATQRGETRTILLRDGSTIDLAAASDLRVNFSGGSRRLTLAAGEAYFKVAHDRQHPFVVATRLGRVVAVGTEFDVRLAADQVTVNVTEGRVNVSPKLNFEVAPVKGGAGQPGMVQIAAGEGVVLTSQRARVALGMQPALPPSWREGRLAYRSEPLKYVVADLNRYSAKQVIIGDPKVGEFEYSGTITPAAIDDWAVGLTKAFPIVVDRKADGTYVISAR